MNGLIKLTNAVFHQTNHDYKGHKILIRSKEDYGIMALILFPGTNSVRKVVEYSRSSPLQMLIDAEKEVDKF